MFARIRSLPPKRTAHAALPAAAAIVLLSAGLGLAAPAVPPDTGVYRAFPHQDTDGIQIAPPTAPTGQQLFVNQTAQFNLLEIRLGQLALQKSGNDAVQRYANRMIAQHSRLHQELANVAAETRFRVPAHFDAPDARTLARLEPLQGAAFDHAYLDASVSDHEAALAAFEDLTPGTASGGVPLSPIVDWAARQLPLLNSQLALGQSTQQNLQTPDTAGGM